MHIFNAHTHCSSDPSVDLSVVAGAKLCDWPGLAEQAKKDKKIIPAFGLHPWYADTVKENWIENLTDFLNTQPSCIGEIGLDKVCHVDFTAQKNIFLIQLKLAVELNRPVIIHCVKAWGELLQCLNKYQPEKFLLHSYGGPADLVGKLAASGAWFSFGAELLNPARAKARAALTEVPLNRLFFETDAALLVQQTREVPALKNIIAAAAIELKTSPELLLEQTWKNAENFLGPIWPPADR